MSNTETARKSFAAYAESIGSTATAEEEAILKIGREFLPPCALVVLDGGEATEEYYAWLTEQTREAQAEHDAEVAAGHEWHGVSR